MATSEVHIHCLEQRPGCGCDESPVLLELAEREKVWYMVRGNDDEVCGGGE